LLAQSYPALTQLIGNLATGLLLAISGTMTSPTFGSAENNVVEVAVKTEVNATTL